MSLQCEVKHSGTRAGHSIYMPSLTVFCAVAQTPIPAGNAPAPQEMFEQLHKLWWGPAFIGLGKKLQMLEMIQASCNPAILWSGILSTLPFAQTLIPAGDAPAPQEMFEQLHKLWWGPAFIGLGKKLQMLEMIQASCNPAILWSGILPTLPFV